jgi:hypothetical protein
MKKMTHIKYLIVSTWLIFFLLDSAFAEGIRTGKSFAGNKVFTQMIDEAELKKSDWIPGDEDPPLSPSKAINLSREFCKNNIAAGVTYKFWQLRLVSRRIGEVDSWYWVVLYEVESRTTISGRSMLSIPISFSGKIMLEVAMQDSE